MKAAYLYLGAAIVAEVIATSLLKTSQGFTRLWPSVATVIGYAISFYCLAQTLGSVPTGVAYAIWSGVGIVLISLIAWWVFGQTLDAPALIGMGLIVAGVVVINLFSTSVAH
ncbi:EmrE family multidrug efflux SMR transporter [Hydrogenophaga sp. H7]|uniref:EmrE family multidrug efflux SMR transporter n=1 Tax=Hydrogenophaga sp. H7 TaxID=1882399 RepID=UPI0009A31713|nr:EmrE family multidrug efflux SMR transporter [Hydrogenophaga sp. H7]OPF64461.1 multidrug transporter [Hydrogenophaga sp. H7]